jgi:hypothetical protein
VFAEPAILDFGFGQAMLALTVRFVNLRPGRGEDDLTVEWMLGEAVGLQCGAGKAAQRGEGIDKAAVEEGPAGIGGRCGVVGSRHRDDAVDEGAGVQPGQGGSAGGLFLPDDAAPRLGDRGVAAALELIDEGRFTAA